MRPAIVAFIYFLITSLLFVNAFEVNAQSTPPTAVSNTTTNTAVSGAACIKVGTPPGPMPSACALPKPADLAQQPPSQTTTDTTQTQTGEIPTTPSGEFVFYCQGDPKWDNRSGCGMGQAGCGPTSLAMVFSSLGKTVTPPEMLDNFNSLGRFSCKSEMTTLLTSNIDWVKSQGFTVSEADLAKNGSLNLELAKQYIDKKYLIIGSSYTFQARTKSLNHIFVVQDVDPESNSVYIRDPQNCDYNTGVEINDPNYNSRKANGSDGIKWAYAYAVGKL